MSALHILCPLHNVMYIILKKLLFIWQDHHSAQVSSVAEQNLNTARRQVPVTVYSEKKQ